MKYHFVNDTAVKNRAQIFSALRGDGSPEEYTEVELNFREVEPAKLIAIYEELLNLTGEEKAKNEAQIFEVNIREPQTSYSHFNARGSFFMKLHWLFFNQINNPGEVWVSVDHDYDYDYNRQGYIEKLLNLKIHGYPTKDFEVEFEKFLKKFELDGVITFTAKKRTTKHSLGSPDEKHNYLLKDRNGNVPHPGDLVAVMGQGKHFFIDTFIGFNKASWKTLSATGYGYVVKRHPVNEAAGADPINYGDVVL